MLRVLEAIAALTITLGLAMPVCAETVPIDQEGFQAYVTRMVAPLVSNNPIRFDTPYMLKIVSPSTGQWVTLPIESVHDECTTEPDICDKLVAAYVEKLKGMLPGAIAARDKRGAHDNSVQRFSAEGSQDVMSNITTLPENKAAFTQVYADALAKALPGYTVRVADNLRVKVQPPGLGTHMDKLDDLYDLCSKDGFKCGDGFTTWLTLDVAEIIRQAGATQSTPP